MWSPRLVLSLGREICLISVTVAQESKLLKTNCLVYVPPTIYNLRNSDFSKSAYVTSVGGEQKANKNGFPGKLDLELSHKELL